MNNAKGDPNILSAAVDAYRHLPKGISVSTAIEAMTGFKIIPLNLDTPQDLALLDHIGQAASHCAAKSVADPIISARVNEVGNLIEPRLKISLEAHDFDVSWPCAADGTGGRSGYPDLLITQDQGHLTYIEVKAVGHGQESSSFRSFYLSPSEKPKIVADARHLLVGFGYEKVGTSDDGHGLYSLTGFKIVDLYEVVGQIKFEYQSSNKGLYGNNAIKLAK